MIYPHSQTQNIIKVDPKLTKPLFPQFKLLELSDKEQIEKYVKQFSPYSDYNFTSLWYEDTTNDASFSWLNGNLVIIFRDYLYKKPFYSFLGNLKVTETIDEIFRYIKIQQITNNTLQLIPEESIKEILNVPQANYSIQEDLNQHDYIISLKDTLSLSNINPHKQKAYYNFLETYPKYQAKELDISNPKTQAELIELFLRWKDKRGKKFEDIASELSALQKLFDSNSYFNLFSLGIYVKKQLVGFLIDERIQKPYVIGHFTKADPSYLGIYEVLNKISAEMHYSKGYKFINIEQDLGIIGLRISKLQRNPKLFLKKYIISIKG